MPKAFPLSIDPLFISQHGFYSDPTPTVGIPAPTPLWTIATAPARTAGHVTTIYQLHITNETGGQGFAWLEVGGTVITPRYQLADDQSLFINWPAGLRVGDQDIDLNATANGIVGQASGVQV